MSTMVATQTQYTPEDLLAMPDGKSYELVGGQLVERSMGMESSWVATRLVSKLEWFCEEQGTGIGLYRRQWLSVFPPRTGSRPQARCLVHSVRSLARWCGPKGLGQDPSRSGRRSRLAQRHGLSARG